MEIISYFESDEKKYWKGEIGKSKWGAGKLLYRMICENTFFEFCGQPSEILLLVEGKTLVSYCTFAKQDEIKDLSLSPWIGFVFTFPKFRGHRYVGRLIEYAEDAARRRADKRTYISTGHKGLYEKYGYTFLKRMKNYNGHKERVYYKDIV